jgi:hypothetical protein
VLAISLMGPSAMFFSSLPFSAVIPCAVAAITEQDPVSCSGARSARGLGL